MLTLHRNKRENLKKLGSGRASGIKKLSKFKYKNLKTKYFNVAVH